MTLQHGFRLLKEEQIDEINSLTRLYKHDKSGAEFLSVINDDEHKVFGVTFRTPPETSNGIAHIMEHCVLGGSRKYPLKEPFIELVKGSLNTFLNAFTYPDKTCYPVASQNTQDLYNLVDVYLDSVFHPLITPHHLDQEGWHYEIDPESGKLQYKGVVFNEMKGAYSSPEGVLGRYRQASLFTEDHPYGVDSGGDPTEIPNLTYEAFKNFHETFYHPANARIYFYGDDDPTERLRLLNEYLDEFEAKPIDSDIDFYPLRDEPQQFVYPYAADPAEADTAKRYVSVNWLLPAVTDRTTRAGLSILSHILSGTAGSPLQKALVDSGLGEDTLGGGFATHLRQPFFSSGLKGVTAEDVDKIAPLIIKILTELAEEGIDPATVEASINTVEFRLRESNTGSFPRGLVYMLGALDDWLYDGDPMEGLKYEETLQAVKDAVADGGYFEGLLRRYLLQNDHRTTVILEPDPDLGDRMEREEAARLEALQEKMTPAEIEAIKANARALQERQERADSPEDLAKLPSLQLDDLQREVDVYPIETETLAETDLVTHDLFTNGIIYFRIGMNLRALPQDLLPYVPLFGYALTDIGTKDEDYVKLSQRIGRTTGGIGTSQFVSEKHNDEKALAWLWLRGKAIVDHGRDMLDIMRDVLLDVKLDDQNRFRQMVLEEKAGEESSVIPGGHSMVMGRLRAKFSEAGWLNEITGGLDYLYFLRDLVDRVENDWPGVLENLETIRRLLVNRANMLCDVTLDQESMGVFRPALTDFLQALPTAELTHHDWQRPEYAPNEGLTIPAQVNFVGKATRLYDHGYEYNGSINVITNMMRTGYLWEKVRMRGGAYGAFMPFNSMSGIMGFCSYRDPNLQDTLNVYDAAADFLRDVDLSQDAVEKAIIGVIGSMDSYRLPDSKGYTALIRHLHGITTEYRQQRRDEVLGTTVQDFRDFAEVLTQVRDHGRVVVLGSPEKISAANAAQPDWLSVQRVM